MKTIITNALSIAAYCALLFALWEIPCLIHSRFQCNHHDCNWFWCDHYNGK